MNQRGENDGMGFFETLKAGTNWFMLLLRAARVAHSTYFTVPGTWGRDNLGVPEAIGAIFSGAADGLGRASDSR